MSLLFATSPSAQYGSWGWGMGHMMNYSFGGLLMWLVFLGLIVLAVWVVLRMARSAGQGGLSGQPPAETPLEILKKRYARGEITREQYEAIRKDLEA